MERAIFICTLFVKFLLPWDRRRAVCGARMPRPHRLVSAVRVVVGYYALCMLLCVFGGHVLSPLLFPLQVVDGAGDLSPVLFQRANVECTCFFLFGGVRARGSPGCVPC